MSTELYPLVLSPRLVPKLWGGQRLAALGKDVVGAQAVGESWELYADGQGSAKVAVGPAQGRSLAEMAGEWGAALEGVTSLLIKFIDAQQDLSVQVHPDDALAKKLEGPKAAGKSEMWVVLDCEPGARLLSGFKPGVTLKDFDAAVTAGTVEDLLNAVWVKPGDVLDIPAGRVHAIGAGCLVAEVQQNSDITYRVWDYGRLEFGQPRALHLAQARQALRFDAPFASETGLVHPETLAVEGGQRQSLVEGPYFSVARLRINAPLTLPAQPGPQVCSVLAGQLSLAWAQEGAMMVAVGQTFVLPAGLGVRLEPQGPWVSLLVAQPR